MGTRGGLAAVAVTVHIESMETGGGGNSTDVAVIIGKGRVGNSQMGVAIWSLLLALWRLRWWGILNVEETDNLRCMKKSTSGDNIYILDYEHNGSKLR